MIYAEELHWGCAGIALAISASTLAAAGSPPRARPSRSGAGCPSASALGDEIKFGAYGVTEAGAGSDVKSLRTTAKRDGDEWVLNGTKVFISNGGIADVNVIVATVDPELGHRGQASFIVEKGREGLSHGQEGGQDRDPRLADTEVVLEDVRVPMDNLLGGLDKLERKLERPARASAAALGRPGHLRGHAPVRRRERARHRPRRRTSGRSTGSRARPTSGEPLLEQQRIQQVIADVATEIEAARLLVWRAAWMGRNGVPMTGGQGSMSKLKAGDMAMWATTTLMDLVGPEASPDGPPAGEVVPRRQDLPDLRGHGPANGSSSRACRPPSGAGRAGEGELAAAVDIAA